jgi:hypothetical protein
MAEPFHETKQTITDEQNPASQAAATGFQGTVQRGSSLLTGRWALDRRLGSLHARPVMAFTDSPACDSSGFRDDLLSPVVRVMAGNSHEWHPAR